MESKDDSQSNKNSDSNENVNLEELHSQILEYKENRKYEECIELIQNNIYQVAEQYSKNSKEYYNLAKEVCDICSIISEEYYNEGNLEEGVKYLDQCVTLFQNFKPILHLCYNNLGNFYRKLSMNDKALEYYDKSLKISNECNNKKNVAEGHINYAITLLSINKVKLSLEQTLAGIILLQECFIDLRKENNNDNSKKNKSSSHNKSNNNNNNENNETFKYEEFEDPAEKNADIYSMLENSYILVAICQFKLGNLLESLLYYELAYKIRLFITSDKNKTETENNNNNKSVNKSSSQNNNSQSQNIKDNQNEILNDSAKLKMLRECLNQAEQMNKNVSDKNEKMSNNYIKQKIITMINEIVERQDYNEQPLNQNVSEDQKDQISRFHAMRKQFNK